MQSRTRTAALANAVIAAYERAGLEPAQLLQGPIDITDLAWQSPPIELDCKLMGLPFSAYVGSPITVDLPALYKFYSDTLYYLRNNALEVSSIEGFKRSARALPRSSSGERKLVFPLPDAWPEGTHTTGQTFAMDAAWLCSTSVATVTEFVSDDSNYYAVTPEGVIGVVGGRPSVHADIWDVDCSGLVPSMLAMPRGSTSIGCHYDLIDRLRSVLHSEPDRFEEFEGVDWGLQTLRILADGEHCKPLIGAVQSMAVRTFKRKAKVSAFDEALAVMGDWQYTDRAKISALFEILVPSQMTKTSFCVKIADVTSALPAVLSVKKEQRILSNLRAMRDAIKYGKN